MTGRARLLPVAAAIAFAAVSAEAQVAVEADPAEEGMPDALLEPVFLLSVGEIVGPSEYHPETVVLGSEKEGSIEDRSLTVFDRLYVPRIVEGRPLEPGDRVRFFRIEHPVVDPDTGEPVGRVLAPTGVGLVEELEAEVARVVVVHAYAPVLIGDGVGAVTVADTTFGTAAAVETTAAGYVLAFQREGAIHPLFDRLFLRVVAGRPAAGDLVELYREGPVRGGRRLPDVVLGRARIVRVDGEIAAAVVTRNDRSDLAVGDLFREIVEPVE